jgi:hypothetical protein
MRYRKKPIVIEAFKWTGDAEQVEDPVWICDAIRDGRAAVVYPELRIKTLEGTMIASPGDWIIKGVVGEIYPCRNDIFEATYEKVE